ncbi:SH3 domain-containing protein [Mesorhizobium sp. BR1-1-6]|uniref:SH3 domain-containing protein n=1 Tax=Mesorhizobium sp. BR1-1-6 TaxID=2876648 RepID=UPI001CD080F5|nr:SH3 domain-containing protein [Mesorhizobium sp. BR1-1-6]MBZ9898536.1 SH3 domain-containing protein [Mesorhizobium sp. BR1-1-6]
MARQPRNSTEGDAVSKNKMPTDDDSDEHADSINEEVESGDAHWLDANGDNDEELSSKMAPVAVDLDLDALTESSPASRNIHVTNARDGLNLRSGPSTEFPIVRSLPLGTRVDVTKREGRWALVDEKGDGD